MDAFDVAIVGAGPTGALLGNLLGQCGISTLVLDREREANPLPRAIHFDGECMRIFQSVGLAGSMTRLARTAPAGTRFINAQGETLLVRRGFAEAGPHAWAVNWYFHQPDLEGVLRDGLRRFGGVTLRLGHEVASIAPDADGATIHAQDLGSGEAFTARARYVVGCDGARSLVRKAMRTEMEDLGLHQPWLVVDLLVDPASPRVQAMPEYSVQRCDPRRPMSIIYVGGNRRRWEIMLMPGDDPARMTDPDVFWPMLADWIGPEDGAIERSAVYTFHSLIARGWRRGPLMIAGDSAHQMPPFLGQGMCAGLRDAANLAWKLALVLDGVADDALLDSYEPERSPHVRTFIDLAIRLGGVIQTTDPAVAAERDRQFASGTPEILRVPDPALGPGVTDPGSANAGRVFPQPRLSDGTLLDDRRAGRFAIIAAPGVIDGIDPASRAIWRRLGAAILSDGALLHEDGAAILLRPDGYVFGAAQSAAALSALTAGLARSLHLVRDQDDLAPRPTFAQHGEGVGEAG